MSKIPIGLEKNVKFTSFSNGSCDKCGCTERKMASFYQFCYDNIVIWETCADCNKFIRAEYLERQPMKLSYGKDNWHRDIWHV